MAPSSLEAPRPQLYLDEKWRLSKKEGCRSSRSSISPLGKKPMSAAGAGKSSTHRRCSFTRRCARLVKEQRARFYIMRRCVTMLVCWRDYTDDS